MKKKKLKLSLNKMTVAKIKDVSHIKGGSQEVTYVGDASCPQTQCLCGPPSIDSLCEVTTPTACLTIFNREGECIG